MSENIKVEALDVEEKSIAEKEAEVQKIPTNEDGDYTVNLGKINKEKEETDAVQEQSTDESVLRGSGTDEKDGQKADVELQEVQQEEQLTLEEVIEEEESEVKEEPKPEDPVEELKEEIEEAVQTAQDTATELPENIQKVVDFMNETGGTLEDYVKINQDSSNIDDSTLLYQ